MKTFSHAAFLAAASALSLRADIFDSPMVRVTPELDLFATATARVEYDDNLFLGNNGLLPEAGTSYDLTPGLEFQYGKDLPFTGTLKLERRFRSFFDSRLRQLDDEQDLGNLGLAYDGGGPLTLAVSASYAESARNTVEQIALQPDRDGTLVRQVNYAQSVKVAYKFTERTSGSLGLNLSRNRYDPRVYDQDPDPLIVDIVSTTDGLSEYDTWSVPLNLSYKISEKLSLGVALSHAETDTQPARGSLAGSAAPDTLVSDFYGLTFYYAPTDKLMYELQAGIQDSRFKVADFARQSPSFSLRVTHMITEKLDQGLTVDQSASTAPNGALNDSLQVAYDINYNNSDAFRTFARVGYSQSAVESASFAATDVETLVGSLGGSYTPDTHWVFSALYTHTRALTGNYSSNRLNLEAAFRW